VKSEKDNIRPLMQRMHEARTAVRDAIHAAGATEASVRVAAAKVADVQADLAVERLKLFAKISPILTEEQRAKLKELRSQRAELRDHVMKRFEKRFAE